jgi:hypothetical protein
MKKFFLLFFALGVFISVRSQNLLLNSDMNSAAAWTGGACTAPEIAQAPESAYGGPSNSNNVAEVDALSCLQQTVAVVAGGSYTINFDATRRTTCAPDLGPNPGINVKVTGVTSGTVYSSIDYHYNNPDDPAPPTGWVGYTPQVQSFFIPLGSTDTQVRLEITAIDNIEGCGIVMDNVTMVVTSVLAVNLSSFNATAKNNTVDLAWTTTNEVNNESFILYRSKNGVTFSEVGKVNATGNSNGSSYTLNDPQPGSGVTYYRLKMVDKTANFKYSGIVKVNLNSKSLDVAVYPTIVTSVLNYVVESPKAEKLRVMVSDISGKRISSTVESFTSGTTQKSINTSTLASGVYLLTIVDDSNTFKKSVTFKKN